MMKHRVGGCRRMGVVSFFLPAVPIPFYFNLRVSSQEVSRRLETEEYLIIKDFHTAAEALTDAEYSELRPGKLPFFQSKLTWAQNEQVKQRGPKALGGIFSLEVGQDGCHFAYPQASP